MWGKAALPHQLWPKSVLIDEWNENRTGGIEPMLDIEVLVVSPMLGWAELWNFPTLPPREKKNEMCSSHQPEATRRRTSNIKSNSKRHQDWVETFFSEKMKREKRREASQRFLLKTATGLGRTAPFFAAFVGCAMSEAETKKICAITTMPSSGPLLHHFRLLFSVDAHKHGEKWTALHSSFSLICACWATSLC